MDNTYQQSGYVELKLEALGLKEDEEFIVHDLLDPNEPIYYWEGKRNYVKLSPGQAHVFKIEKKHP